MSIKEKIISFFLIRHLKGLTNKLDGSKSYIMGWLMIAYGLSAGLLGHIDWNHAMELMLAGGAFITGRHAVSKVIRATRK